MNCYKHNEIAAEGVCADCNQAICADCRVVVKDRTLCASCARDRLNVAIPPGAGHRPENAANRPRRAEYGGFSSDKSKVTTFLLSFCPGLGHWYLGLEIRGLYFITSFFGLIAVSVLLNAGIVALALGPLWLYAISDAMWAVDDINNGVGPMDLPPALFRRIEGGGIITRSNFGWALILIGAISLFNNLPPYIIPDRVHYWIRNNLFGTVIIGIGVWMLIKRRDNGESGNEGEKESMAKLSEDSAE